MEIPDELKQYCDENDLPLLTVPWEVHLSDMIKDFSIRVFLQDSADEQIVSALISAIEAPDNQDAYRKELLPYFDVDGSFQVMLFTCEGLDAMDTVERKKRPIGFRYIWRKLLITPVFSIIIQILCWWRMQFQKPLCKDWLKERCAERKNECRDCHFMWGLAVCAWIFHRCQSAIIGPEQQPESL